MKGGRISPTADSCFHSGIISPGVSTVGLFAGGLHFFQFLTAVFIQIQFCQMVGFGREDRPEIINLSDFQFAVEQGEQFFARLCHGKYILSCIITAIQNAVGFNISPTEHLAVSPRKGCD